MAYGPSAAQNGAQSGIAEYVEASPAFGFRAERFDSNPIIHREMAGLAGESGQNINGPSLIRVPDWIEDPLGRYYLYFAHHSGRYIRLAYADELEGPWKVVPGGVLPIRETPVYDEDGRRHIASPDVHIDEDQQRIRMYYHGNPPPTDDIPYQMTFAALSADGLEFNSLPDPLGLFYFRTIEHGGWHYAFAKYINDGGVLYRSRDGLTDFVEGPRILPRVRHTALLEHEGRLYVFFSRGGDAPEHIMVSRVENMDANWLNWRFTRPQSVLMPEEDYEGAGEPIEPSEFGSTGNVVHQLRDPAIFEENGRIYLLYSTAGERALAMARLHYEEW
ncbi:MAG: hypothetical protein WD266_00240 [Balneolales bacterium]